MADNHTTTQEVLQKRFDRLLDLVRKTRGHQKEYFKYRGSADLKRARQWESALDAFIDEEVKSRESKQKELF